MKISVSLAACVLFSNFSFCQVVRENAKVISLAKADISTQGSGVSYDLKTGVNTLIEFATGIGGGYDISENAVEYHLAILHPAFYFYTSPKFFYNRKKRLKKNKRLDFNAGNYFGARIKYTTADISSSGVVRGASLFNLHWGLQRRIGLRWNFNAQLGGGYAMDIESGFGSVYPAVDLKFSYIISSEKHRKK